jgi:hypothetical protein
VTRVLPRVLEDMHFRNSFPHPHWPLEHQWL